MKRIIKYTVLTSILFCLLSCSNSSDDTIIDNENPILLKKPKKISIYQGNFQGTGTPMEVYNFEYDGNKLIKITSTNYEVIVEYGLLYNNNNSFSKITETFTNSYTEYTPEYFTTNNYSNRLGRINYKTYVNSQLTGTYQRNYSYDSQNRVIVCSGLNTYTYEYDTENRVIKETQNNGNVKNITYDTKNNVFKNVITPFYKNIQGEQNNLWFGNISNNYLTKGSTIFTYTYDVDNYPIKIVWNNDFLTEVIDY